MAGRSPAIGWMEDISRHSTRASQKFIDFLTLRACTTVLSTDSLKSESLHFDHEQSPQASYGLPRPSKAGYEIHQGSQTPLPGLE